MKTNKHRLRVENPHIKSLASLVSLNLFYQTIELKQWLAFKEKLLNDAITQEGTLVCRYCGERSLLRELPLGSRRSPHNLATIDHVMPISRGGALCDKDNCAIACYSCNQKKKDILPREWDLFDV